MTTTPYAKTTMTIDGGPHVSGAQLVVGGNVVQLLGESTVNWNNQLWQIYEYPPGYALPTGWTNNNGIYECSTPVPATFTIDLATTRWGKYLTRLIVNNGLLAGIYAGPGTSQPLVDLSGVIQTKSPHLGLTDIAFQETNQFDPIRQWIGELKATLRALDFAGCGAFQKTLTAAQSYDLLVTEYVETSLEFVTSGANIVRLPPATALTGAYFKYFQNVSGGGTLTVKDTNNIASANALTSGQGAWYRFSLGTVKQVTPAMTVA